MIHFTMGMYKKLKENELVDFARWIEEEGLHDAIDFTLDGRIIRGVKLCRNEEGRRYYDEVRKEVAWEEFSREIEKQPPVSFFQAVARMAGEGYTETS